MKKILFYLAVVGMMFGGFASPSGVSASACAYPAVRTSIQTTVPYGGSRFYNDLYTVKVINTTSNTCADPTVVITPRAGMGFGYIVSTNGGWDCAPLPGGDPGATVCTNSAVAPNSSYTIRVQYNKIGPISGAATAQLILP